VTRVAVVGHVEWVDFAVVGRLPRPGEILEAPESFRHAAGGGAVAAVQLARMAGGALFLTAVGDDAEGESALDELRGWGVDVHAAIRPAPTRRAFTHLLGEGERTITVTGERLVPHGGDDLPWAALAQCDGVYFTGGDAAALEAARRADVVVATPRGRDALATAGVEVDALVASAGDAGEATEGLPSRRVVLTEGARGGRWTAGDGTTGAWRAEEVPGPPVDTYGCGDTFAAALTLALAAERPIDDALRFAAEAGAWCLAGRGPYGHDVPRLG
jgi:ribokinase